MYCESFTAHILFATGLPLWAKNSLRASSRVFLPSPSPLSPDFIRYEKCRLQAFIYSVSKRVYICRIKYPQTIYLGVKNNQEFLCILAQICTLGTLCDTIWNILKGNKEHTEFYLKSIKNSKHFYKKIYRIAVEFLSIKRFNLPLVVHKKFYLQDSKNSYSTPLEPSSTLLEPSNHVLEGRTPES
jgi:hypothetical protein